MKILMIDDTHTSADEIQKMLESKGFTVQKISFAESGDGCLLPGLYDLLILNEAGTIRGGADLIRKALASGLSIPIVMLSGKTGAESRIEGLNAGADYVISAPVDPREVLACVHAILRRNDNDRAELRFGTVSLDLTSNYLICGENRVRLSSREYEVMRILLHAQGKIVPKAVILSQVWGFDSNAVENHVEVYIGFLRKKLMQIDSNIRIAAVRRMGYQLENRAEE